MSGARQRGHGSHRRRSNFRPQTEALDQRCLLSTLTVLNTNDSGTGSLRAEIAAASKGDTIVFDPSLDGQTINLTSGELVINNSLTVQGPGAGQLAISCGGLSRALEVDYAKKENVTVSGLTISHGNGLSGGAILNYGNLTVSNCALTGNGSYQVQIGGAIDNAGGSLTVSGCTIAGNTASPQGGGIFNSGTMTISNSTLSGNSATGRGQGGAIYNGGTMTISNSTLSGNSALMGGDFGEYGEGGAIYEWYGSLTLSNSTFSDNSAVGSYYGSAIYMYGSSSQVTVTGCTLTDSAGGYGCFIFVEGGSLTVKNSHFHNPDRFYISGPYTDGGGNTFD
jgi:predicted outer membrane repeat protein